MTAARWTLLFLVLISACKRRSDPAEHQTAVSAGELGEASFKTRDGRTRRYYVYRPKGYSASAPPPVVLVLHGGGGNALGAQTSTFTHAAADRHGYLAVYPEGISKRALGKSMATWNGGYCCGLAKQQNVDDVAFLNELLDRLVTEHPYDRARVHLTGISNGAMMAMRFACEHPERVAAISAVAGPGYVAGCTRPKPTAVQLVHGTADGCALYAGGARCGGCWEKAAGDWLGIPVPERHFACTSVDDQAAFWRKVNGCTDTARVTFEKGKARCIEHTECSSGRPVSVCTIDGGGHTWPGSVRGCDETKGACKAFAEATGPINRDMDANDAMIALFSTQRVK